MRDQEISEDRCPLKLEAIACPLCGSSESRRVISGTDNLMGIAGRFHVDACQQCDHRFMNPRPIEDDLPACYPDGYGPHRATSIAPDSDLTVRNPETAVQHRPWYLRYLPLRYIPGLKSFYEWLLEDHAQIFPPAAAANSANGNRVPRALEVGCATGRWLLRLKENGWDVSGVEPGAAAAEQARRSGLNVHHGVLDSLDYERESFDLVAAWMVLEHVPDPRATLTQMQAALVPGGRLLLSVPNAGSWEARLFRSHWYALDLPRHLHHFSPRSIRQLLMESGFERIEVIHQRNLSNVPGSLGICMLRNRPQNRLGRWLLDRPDSPRLWLQLLLAPAAHLLAFFRQGGRMTISAIRAESTINCSDQKRTIAT